MGIAEDRAQRAQDRQWQKAKRIAEAKKLWADGMNTIEIAEKLGVKESSVVHYLEEV